MALYTRINCGWEGWLDQMSVDSAYLVKGVAPPLPSRYHQLETSQLAQVWMSPPSLALAIGRIQCLVVVDLRA